MSLSFSLSLGNVSVAGVERLLPFGRDNGNSEVRRTEVRIAGKG